RPKKLAIQSLERSLRLTVIKVLYRPADFIDFEAIGCVPSQGLQKLADITRDSCSRSVERVGVDGDSHEWRQNEKRYELSAARSGQVVVPGAAVSFPRLPSPL